MTLGRPTRTWIAVAVVVVAFGAYALGTWLDLAVNPQGPGESTHWSDSFWPAAFLGFPVVGAIIAARLSRNRIGWLLCAVGLSISLATFATEYAQFALVTRPGTAPVGSFFASLATWVHFLGVGSVLTLLIVFPSGSPRNRFWRWVVRWVVVATSAMAALYATRPGPLDGLREVDNPLGISLMERPGEVVIPVLGSSLALTMAAAAVDKIWAFVKSSGVERQQIKWFALAALAFPAMFMLTIAFEGVIGGEGNQGEFDPVVLVFFFGFNGMAAAIGVAVFKYRLYDIGTVVNRALVYATLTAVLAAAYVGLVFALQAVLAPVTAESDLAIAASTLAVAALFRPLRARIQTFIDHRFYRRKFDVQQTLEEFSEHVRDEVDLASLSSRLEGVVKNTMQPAHVSLWLRSEP